MLSSGRRCLFYTTRASYVRRASNKPAFPFPSNPNPTPHQIFHLPRNAPQDDVKARYFDLVRIYHPDKVDPSTPSEVAHARFQAIATAYNALKTGSAAHHPVPTPAARAMYKRSRNLYSGQQLYDDSWKDRIIVASVIFAAFCFAIQTAATRRTFIEENMFKRSSAAVDVAPAEDARLAAPDEPS
ncbi:hypothetical protein C8J57DRAFT_1496054 [Mycena rebaudengoi]|nr:hypothetical protein C8J57DRAFT_1496054 [Mycena rebaudengoi]